MAAKYRAPRSNIDDIDDESLEPTPAMETGFSKIIVVDNTPVVGSDRYERLNTVLHKVFSAYGTIQDIHAPKDENGGSKGYIFIEYTTPEGATEAVQKGNNKQLDPKHIMRVDYYDNLSKYLNVPDTYQTPDVPVQQPKENLRSWLHEKRVVDQYILRYGDQTEVCWNDLNKEEPETVMKRKDFADEYVGWSPLGTYIFTVHTKGIALWGGPSFSKIIRFPHDGVKLVDFSPNEKYLVTCSPGLANNDNPNDPNCIIVWDVRSGKKLRGYVAGSKGVWPIFKWSHDDKFLARIGENVIQVYETPSMDLLDKKSLSIQNIKDFSWCPTQNTISYFVPEQNNIPAAVVLLDIPSKSVRRQKNVFNVNDCKLHWQSNGEYLAARIDRVKNKKPIGTTFEIFRIKAKDIPTEQIELKDNVHTFAWEPKGTRFAVVHGDPTRPEVSFYDMQNKLKHLKTLEKKQVNALYWSPQGDFIVLASQQSSNLHMEFFNVNEMEPMANEEHYNASHLEWDPTGRFVATSVSFWNHQVETGYNIYSFQGKPLRHILKERFYQVLWRPRPATLLSDEKIKYIKNNLHKYFKEFKQADDEEATRLEEERFKKREEMRAEFNAYMQQRQQDYENERSIRRKLRGDESEDEEDFEYHEEWIEEIEDRKEQIIDG